jgi:DNA-binding transcriptional LysR family regulator
MRRKLPSTQSLICFEAAARHTSFTKAAQELALTQGAVSRQVSALEDLLSVPLFKRGQHGMQLTRAGQAYALQVNKRLNALERDTLDMMGGHGQTESLTLATVPTFASRWLIPRLPSFVHAFPQHQIHIETRTRPFLFSDSGMDAALYAGTPAQVAQWAGTEATKLFDEEVIPVCSPALLRNKRQLTPSHLAHMPLLQQSTRPEAFFNAGCSRTMWIGRVSDTHPAGVRRTSQRRVGGGLQSPVEWLSGLLPRTTPSRAVVSNHASFL